MNRFRVREIQCKRDDNNRGYYDSVDAIDDDPGHESRISRPVVLPTHAFIAEPFSCSLLCTHKKRQSVCRIQLPSSHSTLARGLNSSTAVLMRVRYITAWNMHTSNECDVPYTWRKTLRVGIRNRRGSIRNSIVFITGMGG